MPTSWELGIRLVYAELEPLLGYLEHVGAVLDEDTAGLSPGELLFLPAVRALLDGPTSKELL